MSRTLNLVERLLARGRKLHRLGAHQEALNLLTRLAGLRDLPRSAAAEIQARLAHIHLKRRKFARARRHLAAVLVHRPGWAPGHFHMARAAAADPRLDRERVVEHLRRCAELAPEQPRYLSAFGAAALKHGLEEEGLTALRRACTLAPDDLRVLRRLSQALCRAGHEEEARGVLRAALFRNARDGRYRQLWQAFQFEQLHARQEAARRRRAANLTEEDGLPLLPFVRIADVGPAQPPVRRDGPSRLPAPHLPRPARRPDQRHAQ